MNGPQCPKCGSSEYRVCAVNYYTPEQYRTHYACRGVSGDGEPCGHVWFTRGELRGLVRDDASSNRSL